MAKYKVLKSVAHNIGASFTSLMNYSQTDYVMGILLRHARKTGDGSFCIDFVSGQWSPIFDRQPLDKVAPFYTKMFWENVQRQGSDRSMVKSAKLEINFNIKISRPVASGMYEESPYTCVVSLVDSRGIAHGRTLQGWWFPEPYIPPAGLRGWIMRLRWHFGV